jgi:hypothetical protein
MGDMANDERAAAAAEIESLRHGQREMMRTIATRTVERDEARHGECVATATLQGWIEERTTLRAERDEARREICHDTNGISPTMVAEDRGWDCFKENTDG